jgi:hypothetical protein
VSKLAAKTREDFTAALADTPRSELVELLFRATTLEPLLTAREIAEASHVDKADVIAAMKAGQFVDPVLGPGFFCRHDKLSRMRVTVAAAVAWRRRWFMRAEPVLLYQQKKRHRPRRGIGVDGKKVGQRVISSEARLQHANGPQPGEHDG